MLKFRFSMIAAVLGVLALVFGACSAEAPETGAATGESDANFRFLISDDVNEIDNFSSVIVTVSKIGFQQGGESGGWQEFTPDITEVDLKPLSGDNALEIWSGNLSAGTYSKVFIYVTEVNGTLIPELGGERADIKLPSNKLQISKPFTISENETTSFVYDITVIKAGQSGQYILQPQISESGADKEFNKMNREDDEDEEDADKEEPDDDEIEEVEVEDDEEEDENITEEDSRETAEEFVKDSPTFEFDGIEETLSLVETLYPDIENTWQFVFTFDSLHAGYGDRSDEVLAEVITPHEAIITVENGEAVTAVMDEIWDMINQEMIEN